MRKLWTAAIRIEDIVELTTLDSKATFDFYSTKRIPSASRSKSPLFVLYLLVLITSFSCEFDLLPSRQASSLEQRQSVDKEGFVYHLKYGSVLIVLAEKKQWIF